MNYTKTKGSGCSAAVFPYVGDLAVVNSARISFNKLKKRVDDSDAGLINYLAKHNHFTPFTHVRITMSLPKSMFARSAPVGELYDVFTTSELTGCVMATNTNVSNHVVVRHSIWGWAALLKKMNYDSSYTSAIISTLFAVAPLSAKAILPEDLVLSNLGNVPEGYFYNSIEITSSDKLPVIAAKAPYFMDVTLFEEMPIYVARQRFKHMVGFSYNEVSRRYVKEDFSFAVPNFRYAPEGSVKQGSGKELDLSDVAVLQNHAFSLVEDSTDMFEYLDSAGVAMEQARAMLPMCMLAKVVVTGDVPAWGRFIEQRKDSHAQKEIQELALQCESIVNSRLDALYCVSP